MSSEFWKQYNESIAGMVEYISGHNNQNLFNYVEESFYPHVRDIVALTIAQLQYERGNKYTRVLDFGSNEASVVNLKNKIDTEFLRYVIYDPYSEVGERSPHIDFLNYRIIRDATLVHEMEFDLVVFGSSVQYIDDVQSVFEEKYILNASKILFTHTPFSLSSKIKVRQYSSYTGYQFLHSFEEVKTELSKNNFKLAFKSTLNPEFSAVEDKYLDQVVYANLLFIKELSE